MSKSNGDGLDLSGTERPTSGCRRTGKTPAAKSMSQ